MTKKPKDDITESTESLAEEITAPAVSENIAPETEAPTEAPTEAEDPDAGLPFTIDQWRGLPCYRCRQCPYDTLKEDEAWEHAEKHRTVPVTPTGAPVLIYGPDGQPITI